MISFFEVAHTPYQVIKKILKPAVLAAVPVDPLTDEALIDTDMVGTGLCQF